MNKENNTNYPALIALLALFIAFFTGVAIENKDKDDNRQETIQQYESEYGYIPKYEV